MTSLLPLFAVFVPGIPAGCGLYSAVRWALDRHAMTLAFTKPRERRRNPWRQ